MGIEEEIADEISGIQVGTGYYSTTIGIDAAKDAAAALSPLLNRVRAEAMREVAKNLNENFQSIPAWGEAYRQGIRTDEWMNGAVRMMNSAIEVIHAAADAVEQNSEGNEA